MPWCREYLSGPLTGYQSISFSGNIIRDISAFMEKVRADSTVSYPEQSIAGNFTFEAARHLFVSGGCSVRHYPWLKYRSSSPSTGVTRELRVKYLPAEKISFDLLYSYRMSMADDTSNNRIP